MVNFLSLDVDYEDVLNAQYEMSHKKLLQSINIQTPYYHRRATMSLYSIVDLKLSSYFDPKDEEKNIQLPNFPHFKVISQIKGR